MTTQNYGRMITTWQQRARRDGIVVKQIKFKVPPPSTTTSSTSFAAAITPRTRAIEVTHITNLTGQILPVRDDHRDGAAEGNRGVRRRGACIRPLPLHARRARTATTTARACTSGCSRRSAPDSSTCAATSQKSLWPMMAAPASMDANIRKYEEIGTHPAANHNAIASALAFHRAIGADRKVARLRYLRDRWAERFLA